VQFKIIPGKELSMRLEMLTAHSGDPVLKAAGVKAKTSPGNLYD
jgi:hypothetical protein